MKVKIEICFANDMENFIKNIIRDIIRFKIYAYKIRLISVKMLISLILYFCNMF